jgi:AraC family transcriptional regulator
LFETIRFTASGNPGGEFSFTSPGLYLSFHLGQFLRLEQRGSDGQWQGASLRGDVKVVLPGEQRTFIHRLPARFAGLHVPLPVLQKLEIAPARLRPHLILRDDPLRLMLEALQAEGSQGRSNPLFLSGAVQAILARLADLNGRGDRPVGSGFSARKLERALELINDRLDERLSVLELATACELSPSHFSTLFKGTMGESPYRYQIRRRVERAESLMRHGVSAAEAAVASGFYDQSHLARHLLRVRGRLDLQTVGTYRAKVESS